MKRNEQGFSLIELLISTVILALVITGFLSIMASATNIFSKSNREVNLQEEAQIVANQIEDILCDSTVYVGGSPSNEIIVFNTDSIYRIYNDGDKLLYSQYAWPASMDITKDSAIAISNDFAGTMASATVLVPPVLMASYVEDFQLDTSTMATKNYVTWNVHYKNGDREIAANQAIYLRNLLGTGTSSTSVPSADLDYDEELTVLRYKAYDLKELFGVKAVGANGTFGPGYYVNQAACTVQLEASINSALGASDMGTILVCTKDETDEDGNVTTNNNYRIKLKYDEVSMGLPTVAGIQPVILATGNVTSVNNYVTVKGFDTKAAGVSYEVLIEGIKVQPGVLISETLPELPYNNQTDGNYYRYYIENSGYLKKLPKTSAAALQTGLALQGEVKFFNGKWNGTKWAKGDNSYGYMNCKLTLKTDPYSEHLIFEQSNQYVGDVNYSVVGMYITVVAYYNNSEIARATVRLRKDDSGVLPNDVPASLLGRPDDSDSAVGGGDAPEGWEEETQPAPPETEPQPTEPPVEPSDETFVSEDGKASVNATVAAWDSTQYTLNLTVSNPGRDGILGWRATVSYESGGITGYANWTTPPTGWSGSQITYSGTAYGNYSTIFYVTGGFRITGISIEWIEDTFSTLYASTDGCSIALRRQDANNFVLDFSQVPKGKKIRITFDTPITNSSRPGSAWFMSNDSVSGSSITIDLSEWSPDSFSDAYIFNFGILPTNMTVVIVD